MLNALAKERIKKEVKQQMDKKIIQNEGHRRPKPGHWKP